DLYAFGATFYRAVTGKPPEEETLRVADDRMVPTVTAAVWSYRQDFLAAIDACMRVKHKERPYSVAELRPMLFAWGQAVRGGAADHRIVASLQSARSPGIVRSVPRRWAIVAALSAVAGGAYGGMHYV